VIFNRRPLDHQQPAEASPLKIDHAHRDGNFTARYA
jgi:hypothetical protein